jgi:dolichyl-diphosphooligosaccharide--protein glycosyltransferase/undecaprenyl-diphosphooligosaccharide--protein glycosyltransferase
MSRSFSETQKTVELGRGLSFNKQEKTISVGKNKIPVKRFVKTFYDVNMQLQKEVVTLNENGDVNLIYMSNYNIFLVLDEKTYNSLYIQLMVLEEYDETLFEKVVSSPHAKVYKLKI